MVKSPEKPAQRKAAAVAATAPKAAARKDSPGHAASAKTVAKAAPAPTAAVKSPSTEEKRTESSAPRDKVPSGVSKLHASKSPSASQGSPAPLRTDRSSMSSTTIDTKPSKADPKHANAWKTKPASELTERDILAMPEDEYMNGVQLDFFKRLLTSMREELLRSAGETTEHLREDTLLVPDPADRATIEEEHALELRTRDRERKLLKKVEQSLQRIESGDYGWCEETGEPIGIGRLLARPTATLSLEAQQRRELKQKMFND